MPTGSDRYRGGTSSAYSPLMRQPEKNAVAVRVVLAIVLTLVCPPLGILYMWRAGVFPLPGRVALTLLGGLELALIIVWGMPRSQPQSVRPTPVSPARVTAVSNTEVVSALSNIDVLLGRATPEPAATVAPAPVEETAVDSAEAILDTVVYSVYEGARFYHVSGECRGQVNRRQLTIRQAIEEGLTACGRCNPPSP